MLRYRFWLVVFTQILFLSVLGQENLPKGPNILFILVDDLGYHDLGYTGSKFYETPHIDRLASEGMVFTDAYAASPVCSPSRAGIMTGKHPARLNLTDYIPGNSHYGPHKDQKLASHPFKLYLDTGETTLAEALKTDGYSTFFAGKWHLGETEEYYPDKQGFNINIGGNNTGHPSGGYFSPYKNPQLPDGPDGEYLTDRLTTETIEFMAETRDRPFLAYLSYYTVHLPLQGKPEKVKKYQEKLKYLNSSADEFSKEGNTYTKLVQNIPHYAAMVESLDENIGRLMDALEKNGLAESTLVIFTSDNGGMANSNRTDNIPTANLPLRAGKGYLYEGGVKVPLIFRWSGTIAAGSSSNIPVNGTDFYPTILDLAGIKSVPGHSVDGTSLEPLLHKNSIKKRPVFWYYPHYSGGLGGRPSAAIREGDHKLIRFFEDDRYELYNIRRDPGERNDLASKVPKKKDRLKQRLNDWLKGMAVQLPYRNPAYIGQE